MTQPTHKRTSRPFGALHELSAPFVVTISVAAASCITGCFGNPGGDESLSDSVSASASATSTSDTGTSSSGGSTSSSTSASASTSASTSDTAGSTGTSSSTSTGASSSTGVETDTATSGTTGGSEPGFDPMDDGVQICPGPHASDPFEIYDAAVKNDQLYVDIGYGGGCEEHLFGLCWDGAFAESEPVQVSLDLGHDAQGDLCEAYLMEQKLLDLTPLKQAWIDAYGQQSGTIIIHLAGWADPLQYSF